MNDCRSVALVTGGSQGIGLAITRALLAQNYRVIIADLHSPDAAAFSADIRDRLCFKHCDIANGPQVEQLVNIVTAEYGAISVLVNNAGIISEGAFDQIGDQAWQRVFSINVEGTFRMTKAVLPAMRQQKSGRIINIASVAAQTGGGFLGNTCYAASKGAILAMTKGIAREYASEGITCNAVCPGFVQTPLTARMPEEQVRASLKAIPAARPADPDEIAEAVTFLAGENSRYINGVTLNVDGGLIRY